MYIYIYIFLNKSRQDLDCISQNYQVAKSQWRNFYIQDLLKLEEQYYNFCPQN